MAIAHPIPRGADAPVTRAILPVNDFIDHLPVMVSDLLFNIHQTWASIIKHQDYPTNIQATI
jgi:hypothetical protein